MERVGSYLSYRGTRLADQAIENRAEADSIELESNSTTNRRWKIRLTCGPMRQRNKGRERWLLRLLGRPTRTWQGRESRSAGEVDYAAASGGPNKEGEGAGWLAASWATKPKR
jgi:hypothetical protein